jgi:co-chaperonin GroES (HSP10)
MDSKIIPLHKDILVYDLYFGEVTTKEGIVILSDDTKDRGIHPRWAKVYAVGHEQKDIEIGEWVLIAHGQWSRAIDLSEVGLFDTNFKVRRANPDAILLKTKENPEPEKWLFDGK